MQYFGTEKSVASRVASRNNKRAGWNKKAGWKNFVKIINEQGGNMMRRVEKITRFNKRACSSIWQVRVQPGPTSTVLA